ncbi:hypothetical protein ABZ404_36830 [Streptomyces sp. NPDC005878]
MPHSKAETAAVAARRTKLVQLRRRGVRYDDPAILELGYSSSQHASKDMERALEQALDEQRLEASLFRQQENERLDALLDAVWDRATSPSPVFDKEGIQISEEVDLKAVDTVLKLMDRRAKLNGLDAPVKAELSGPGGAPVRLDHVGLAELNELISRAGDPSDGEAEDDQQDDDLRYVDEDDNDDADEA